MGMEALLCGCWINWVMPYQLTKSLGLCFRKDVSYSCATHFFRPRPTLGLNNTVEDWIPAPKKISIQQSLMYYF